MLIIKILILICFCGVGFLAGCECKHCKVVQEDTEIILEVNSEHNDESECEGGICKPPPGY